MNRAAAVWWYEKNNLVEAIVAAVDKFAERHGYSPTIVVVPSGEYNPDIVTELLWDGVKIEVGHREKDIPPQHFYLYPVVDVRHPKIDVERRPVL